MPDATAREGLMEWAIATGRIPEEHLSPWRKAFDLDPGGTAQRLGRMQRGAAAEPTDAQAPALAAPRQPRTPTATVESVVAVAHGIATERDRYRDALEELARWPESGSAAASKMRLVAHRALHGGPRHG